MLKGRSIAQQCYVVHDLDQAIAFWTSTFGVGPFYVGSISPQPFLVYQGRPAGMEGRIAITYMGDLQIELVEQSNDAPSIYRSFIDSRGEGLHHVMVESVDFAADAAHLGGRFEKAFWGTIPGLCDFAYFDAVEGFGHFIELVALTPEYERFCADMRETCAAWDGSEPRRPWG